MTLLPLQAEADRVQSLLSRLQTNNQGFEIQEEIAGALKRFAAYLEERLPAPPEAGTRQAAVAARTESWLERALREAHMGAWQWDLLTGEIRWSSGLYDLYGVDPAEGPIGHDEFIGMIHPDDRQTVRDEFTRAAEHNGLFSHEFRFSCPDGRMLWIHSAGAVEVDAAGRFVRIGGINHDISARRLAEEALHESREREASSAAELKALMDAVPAMIWIARDPHCRKIDGNRFGYEFLQMPRGANLSKSSDDPETLALQPYENYRDGRPLTESELPMQRAAATGKPVYEQEVQFVFRDGSSKSALGNAIPLMDTAGNPAGAVAAFIDITERKRSEEALRQSQRRVNQLLETSFEGIWSVDANGVTTFVNHRAAEILGYTIEQIRGRNAFEFLMEADMEAGRQTLERIARGESGRVEAHARHKDGNEAWLLVSFSPLVSETGESQGALAMFTDITERKRAEQRLAQSESDLREAQRIARIGSWHWDAQSDATSGSEELYRIFGLDPAAGQFPDFGEQRGKLYPVETWEQLNRAVQAATLTGAGYELDLRAFHGSTPIWITTRGEAAQDAAGRVLGLRGTVQDITERKGAEIFSRAQNEINQIIHSSLDTKEILDRTLSAAAKALESETAAVSLRKDGSWRVSAACGFRDDIVGLEIHDTQEQLGLLALQTKASLAISDTVRDPRVNREHMLNWGICSVLAVPVLLRGDPIAVMFFNYHKLPFEFKPVHLDFAEKFAASLSLALQNAQLYQELRDEVNVRRQAEEQLRSSHTTLQMAMDAARLGTWEVDVATLKADIHRRMAEMVGFPAARKDVPASEWRSIIVGKLPTMEDLRAAASGDGPSELEFQIIPEGASEKRWLHIWADPYRDSSGQIVRFLGIAMDITERKRAEQVASEAAELNEFRVRLMDALRAANEPKDIVTTGLRVLKRQLGASSAVHLAVPPGAEGRVIETASTDASGRIGWLRLSDLGRDLVKDHPGGRPLVLSDIPNSPRLKGAQKAAYQALEVAAQIDVPLIRDGQVVSLLSIRQRAPRQWTEAEVALVLEAAERTWARVERARAEIALRESEERFHTSIETLPQTFTIFSAVRELSEEGAPGKIRDLRYEYVNEAACRMNHLSRDRLIGHTLLGLPASFPARSLFDRYVAVIESGQPLGENVSVLDAAYQEPRERRRTWYVIAARFGDGVVVIRDDVTQQVHLEAERQQAVTRLEIQQRLTEQSETERQNFAREIHDGPVQTLASIGMNLAFIKDAYPDPALRVELDHIGLAVKSASQELRQVINELRPPSPLRFGLSKAIEYHADSVRERSPQISWEYRLTADGDQLPDSVRLALFRIYQEAVANVMRHSQASRAWISLRMRKAGAILEIRDNGKGMPSAIDFEGLTQQHHFGLAGMTERAEAMGGALEIITAPGEGTRIKIVVPLPRKGSRE